MQSDFYWMVKINEWSAVRFQKTISLSCHIWAYVLMIGLIGWLQTLFCGALSSVQTKIQYWNLQVRNQPCGSASYIPLWNENVSICFEYNPTILLATGTDYISQCSSTRTKGATKKATTKPWADDNYLRRTGPDPLRTLREHPFNQLSSHLLFRKLELLPQTMINKSLIKSLRCGSVHFNI